jgi:hypothetical protein
MKTGVDIYNKGVDIYKKGVGIYKIEVAGYGARFMHKCVDKAHDVCVRYLLQRADLAQSLNDGSQIECHKANALITLGSAPLTSVWPVSFFIATSVPEEITRAR